MSRKAPNTMDQDNNNHNNTSIVKEGEKTKKQNKERGNRH